MNKKKFLRQVMSPREIDLALTRIAAEIIEHHPNLDQAVLVGVRRRGVPLAETLQAKIEKQTGRKLPLGILDITFYRDDLSLVGNQPVVEGSQLDFDATGREVILVDDVLFTGRTTRAALESMIDYGRPKRSSSWCSWTGPDTASSRFRPTTSESTSNPRRRSDRVSCALARQRGWSFPEHQEAYAVEQLNREDYAVTGQAPIEH